MVFANRQQAGEILAEELATHKLNPKKTIIAGIPRGGMVVANSISERLGIPLTAVVIKKLGAPNNAELAIGAVAAHGEPVLDQWLIKDLGVETDWIKKEIKKKKREAQKREKYLGVSLETDKFRGKTVIIVDDGLATGQTARAAAKIIKVGAAKIILAVPCASPSTIDLVKDEFAKVICLEVDRNLMAVGQFYRDFGEVSDEEVREILRRQII